MTTAAEAGLPEVPRELSEAGASGHLVVLVGAGASYDSGLPLWKDLLLQLLQRAKEKPLTTSEAQGLREAADWFHKDGEELLKASHLRQVMGNDWLCAAIAAVLRDAAPQPTAMHRALAELPGALFITTNYDTLLEQALTERTGKPPRVVLLSNIDGLRELALGQVLKLHGDIDAPESIVLSSEDYFRVSHRIAEAWKERLKACLQPPYQVLLAGYGYGDVDLQEVVNELRGAYEERLPGPFWLERAGLQQRAKASACGLRPVWVSSHGQKVPWLQALARAITQKKREAPITMVARAYAGKVFEGFENRTKEATLALKEHDYEHAHRLYQEMLDAAEALGAASTHEDESHTDLKRWIARCRLDVGGCLVCLQEPEAALKIFRQVAEHEALLLAPGNRANLSQGLALMGDLDLARAVFPEGDEKLSEEARQGIAVIRQLLELLDGHLPDPLLDSPLLFSHAARLSFDRGEMDQAAHWAMRTLKAAPDDPLFLAGALRVLVLSLKATIYAWSDVVRPVPTPRDEIVRQIENGFERIASLPLPEVVRTMLTRLRAIYDLLVKNQDRMTQACAILDDRSETSALDSRFAEYPPWRTRYDHAMEVSAAGRYAEALAEALSLANNWPEIAPINHLAADLLLRTARGTDAVPYAKRAFTALPAWGYRLLLGQCQLASVEPEEAWETLLPLQNATSAEVLRARAWAAEQARPIFEAKELWERYIAAAPKDAQARGRLAGILFRAGKLQEAADMAWHAVEGPGNERLNASELYACAELQRTTKELDEEARRRIGLIAEALRTRFPGSVEAERFRLDLLAKLGFPPEMPAPDWKRLIEGGMIRTMPADTLEPFLRARMHDISNDEALYRSGRLSFEALCERAATPAALYVSQSLRPDAGIHSIFSPPIAAAEAPTPTLSGARILAGELELLIVQKLGLWRSLRAALGQQGQLLLFRDVWNRILGAALDLRDRARPNEEAADLAVALQQALGVAMQEEWASFVERPRVSELPLAREDDPQKEQTRLAREHLESAFSYREAVVDRPDRWLLTADAFVTSAPGDHPDVLLRLAFSDAAHFMRLSERLQQTSERELHLPRLVRALVPEGERQQQMLLQLAAAGFQEALTPKAILSLIRRHGGLDKEEPARVLRGAERIAREIVHPSAPVASVRLAELYAKAIWEAFCEEQGEAEAKALAGALLGRVEAIDDATAGGTLDLLIQFLGGDIVSKPSRSFEQPAEGETTVALAVDSPGGRVWTYLVSWAGPEGKRRAAYGRGVREVWRRLDEHADQGDSDRVPFAPMILPIGVDEVSLMHPELETPAILSACWNMKPLGNVWNDPAHKHGGLEQMLQHGADRLKSARDSIAFLDARVLAYGPTGGDSASLEAMPTEAILLRAAPEVAAEFAQAVAHLQGIHDGRAYGLLTALAKDPINQNLRRAYARMTVSAPWRLIREDPVMIRSWRWRRALGEFAFPVVINHLCEMLSEPSEALPRDETIFNILLERVAEGGIWANDKREDNQNLCQQACEVPGLLPAFMLGARLSREEADYTREVSESLDRLDHPHEQPAARLAGDIFFLRVAAARKPFVRLPEGEIDLRERLPERFLAVLRAVMSPAPADTFAQAEAALLRLCGQVIQDLARPGVVSLKDGLWLTYRLFQWLVAQLETIPPDARQAGLSSLRKAAPQPIPAPAEDLLNPFGFAPDRFEHRLATVLYAFGFMEELLLQVPKSAQDLQETPRSVTSTELEELLAELAARPLSEQERALRLRGIKPSCLDWHGPGAIPDLALTALLQINREGFFRIAEERRLHWLQDLPATPEDKVRANLSLASLITQTAASHAKKLSLSEKLAFEERLRLMHDFPDDKAKIWRWLGLTELYGAGQLHLEKEIQDMLLDNLANPAAPEAFGSYLTALSFVAPNRLPSEAERILAAVEAAKLDPVSFAPALGKVVVVGAPACIVPAQDLLRQLARRPPYQGHPRIRRLLSMLGIA